MGRRSTSWTFGCSNPSIGAVSYPITSAISIMWVKAIITSLLSQPCISSVEKWER